MEQCTISLFRRKEEKRRHQLFLSTGDVFEPFTPSTDQLSLLGSYFEGDPEETLAAYTPSKAGAHFSITGSSPHRAGAHVALHPLTPLCVTLHWHRAFWVTVKVEEPL